MVKTFKQYRLEELTENVKKYYANYVEAIKAYKVELDPDWKESLLEDAYLAHLQLAVDGKKLMNRRQKAKIKEPMFELGVIFGDKTPEALDFEVFKDKLNK